MSVMSDGKRTFASYALEGGLVAEMQMGPNAEGDKIVVYSLTIAPQDWLDDGSRLPGGAKRLDLEAPHGPPSGRGVLGEHLRGDFLSNAHFETMASFELARPVSPGRSYSDAELAFFARRYLDACASQPRRPVPAMRERMADEGRKVSEGAIRDRLKTARAEGWLVGASVGRSGAAPGPKLTEWEDKETEDA